MVLILLLYIKMPTKVIYINDKVTRPATSSNIERHKAQVTARLAKLSPGLKAGTGPYGELSLKPITEVKLRFDVIIQNAIDRMESTGCEFMNMVLNEEGDGAYLFFKCPAGGAGGAGSARTRSNRKSRRSRTRKN